MKLTDRYNMENLKNRSVEIVFERIEKLIDEREDLCQCRNCTLDLAAFALNRVTPRYYTSLLSPFHPNKYRERRIRIEIDLAIKAGLKRIIAHPHHEEVTVKESD